MIRGTAIVVVLGALVLGPLAAAPPAVGHGKQGTKKYCKHHKKKCRKNRKNQVGRTRINYTLKTKKGAQTWSFESGSATYTEDGSNEEEGFVLACLPNDGEREYWECDGGVKRKRGKAVLHSISWAKGNLFNDTHFKLHHKTTWRWKKKRIKKLSEAWWPDVPSFYWTDEGKKDATLGKPWYEFFDGIRRSGHRRHIGWTMESCMPVIFVLCVQNHPYSRHYVHGDGTFHSSGNNW